MWALMATLAHEDKPLLAHLKTAYARKLNRPDLDPDAVERRHCLNDPLPAWVAKDAAMVGSQLRVGDLERVSAPGTAQDEFGFTQR